MCETTFYTIQYWMKRSSGFIVQNYKTISGNVKITLFHFYTPCSPSSYSSSSVYCVCIWFCPNRLHYISLVLNIFTNYYSGNIFNPFSILLQTVSPTSNKKKDCPNSNEIEKKKTYDLRSSQPFYSFTSNHRRRRMRISVLTLYIYRDTVVIFRSLFKCRFCFKNLYEMECIFIFCALFSMSWQ